MGEITLLLNIQKKRNCTGISLKTQMILAIIFTIRYIDVWLKYLETYGKYTNPTLTTIILYNVIKVAHIFLIYWTILIVLLYFNNHDDRKFDTFRIEILITVCVVLTFLVNHDLRLMKIIRTFHFCLEAVATLPQTYLISKARYMDTVLIYYFGFLSLYKLSHTIYWVFSLVYLRHHIENIALFAGMVQLIVYSKFFINNVLSCKCKSRSIYQQDDKLTRVKVVPTKNQLGHYKINASNVSALEFEF
ncbi:ER lumen protein-retaining receptor 2-like isoform X2 [Phymastichus coffea]|nr:ER lumen protein-retaining receptor 2-like isoform X2 [Phymastichus coffea]